MGSKEYWMINSGPGFPGVVLFGSSPTPPHSPVERQLVCGESEKLVCEKPNHMTARKLGPLQIIQYPLIMLGVSDSDSDTDSSVSQTNPLKHAWMCDCVSRICCSMVTVWCWDSKSICAYQLKIWVRDGVQDEWLYAKAWLFDRCGFHCIPRWVWACDWVQTGFIVEELGSVSCVIVAVVWCVNS
jgi:hypothetical protein